MNRDNVQAVRNWIDNNPDKFDLSDFVAYDHDGNELRCIGGVAALLSGYEGDVGLAQRAASFLGAGDDADYIFYWGWGQDFDLIFDCGGSFQAPAAVAYLDACLTQGTFRPKNLTDKET